VDSGPFLDHLRNSGLLLDEQVADVSGRFSKGAMQVVLDELVGERILTPFQINQLRAGQPKGLVLGQYQLLDELGRGGYGCVYKARHKLMNRVVALKVIAPERVEDTRARAWFRREVLAATQLNHPNIALAYDADEIDGVLFFAMEFIDGLNLDMLIRQRGPLPVGTACEMLLQTAKALQYAHEMGMVHRDIKPANLLIPGGALADDVGEFALPTGARPVLVKIVDFGLARLQDSKSNNNTLVLQNERSFVGTPAYVSPEQARNVHEVDIRSDLYSLGCTFYHALAGRPPFQASSPLQIVVQHLEKEPEPVENHRPEIPSALASIIRRLMAKKPEKRFQTPAELLNELGFFYAQDRNNLPRSIPLTAASNVLVRPAIEHSTSAAQESETSPTRVCLWENEKQPTVESPLAEPGTGVPVADEPVVERPLDQDWIPRWREWTIVVADLSAGHRLLLDDVSYRVLHRQLLDACQSPGGKSGSLRSALIRKIADLVQPWLTLPTLTSTDHETLANLHEQCQAINREIGIGQASYGWLIGVFLLCAIFGFGYLLFQHFANQTSAAWFGLIRENPVAFLVILVPLMLISFSLVLGKLFRTSAL
jgi:eukaryotic-like serine/threonine-protein kinase